ncbi:snapalysin family zinc-dependent metalloprotease [Lentzea tibetensis]|uniref:snapalysin family zinc-dependent metalloprotease n=1 Tax=Lentzea tibetensis TaxID=2591470 RepID=UPI001F25520F|nr:snapalysin family zinc-dependent metalloprotease [Lentzea tibetensis]
MFLRKTIAVLASTAALVVGIAPAAEAAPRVLTYNSNGAAEFKAVVDEGAKVWNDSVKNVKLVKTTGAANITIVADNGWPRAQPTTLGNGRVWMGRQAVDQGYYPPRIASHELGHILGLPDIKPGPCSSLMSGSTGGIPCKNIYPNASEKARVEAKFRPSVMATGEWNNQFVDAG